ncbi:MAG: hypothetical protein P8Y28_05395, partial [Gammaproteobacteria bacterium]
EQCAWIQSGKHKLRIGTSHYLAETVSTIDPELGCKDITMNFNGKSWHAELSEKGLIEDMGVPQWSEKTDTDAHYHFAEKL